MDTSKLMFRPDLLKGQRILVTGGGTGLGKEMSEAFLALGAHVFICGRRGDVLSATADELMAKHGGTVTPIPCDIRSAEAIKEMVDAIWASGPLTGLVNNAAGNFISRTEDLSPRGFDAIANIVFRGTFYMTLEIGKRWVAEKIPGSVISILTTWVWNGSPYTVPSAMSKTAVNAMTQSLAVEWGKHGIRFNAIAPGAFPTKGAWERLSPGQDPNAADSFKDSVPMGRVGQMHEIGNLAAFLMGPGAEYLTGQTIAIDGATYQASGGNFWGLNKLGDEQWDMIRSMIKSSNEKDRAQRTA
jgi:NAD(P)-dependent dehydrogenase (short-subunit alcohol dehydrogenase family)